MITFHIITIFPELFDSRTKVWLLSKAIEKGLIAINYINPRSFTTDRHQTIDDKIYWWGEGLLMKAKPIIDSVNSVIETLTPHQSWNKPWFLILYPSPSHTYFDQHSAFDVVDRINDSSLSDIIFVCGRYEWIDHRFEQYFMDRYPQQFLKISLGKYIVYGWEVPTMIIIEAITRLLPWWTHKPPIDESYYPHIGDDTIENPHFTRPQEIYGYQIPEILISGHHKHIENWRKDNLTK